MIRLVIVTAISFILFSCGGGQHDPLNPNNNHQVVTDLGMYVGYTALNVITPDGLPHQYYQLYTTKVAAGVYLTSPPANTYAIFANNTTPYMVILKQWYDNNGPTRDPATVDIGSDPQHVDEYSAYVPGNIYN